MPDDEFRSELFALAHAHVEKTSELSPISATRRGIEGYDHLLDDYSLAHREVEADVLRSSLAAVTAVEPADDIDRVGRAVMIERLTSELALIDSDEQRRRFSVLWSPASEVRRVFELQRAETPAHAEQIRARLGAVRGSFGSWRGALEEDSSQGVVPARRQSLGVAGQLETYAGGAFSGVARRAAASCGVDAEEAGLLSAAADADLACGELAGWLREEYVPLCTEADPVGPESYAYWSQWFNGAALDLAEIYEWGWEDLKRINSRMWEIAREVAPGAGSLAEAAAALDADESRAVHGTDALLARLSAITTGAVEMLDGVHFDIDERIRFCDTRIAPDGSAAAAYYTGPSEDLSRPGITWFPTLGHERFPIWREVSTWYHESIPGHHLQVATATLEKERQTRFQRVEGFVSGYGEGWALYAERLMEELGAFSDLGDEMGYLSGQSHRAARILVDIGMHLQLPAPEDIGALGALGDIGGRTWDAETAVAMLEELAIVEHETAVSEVDRYLGFPAQAIAYKVGERTWLRCREDARRRLGGSFDLKTWHAYALALGSMGLDTFSEEMALFGA